MPALYQNDKVNTRHLFTFSDIYHLGNTVQYSGMTNAEIRRENARWLAKQCGGPTAFAELMDMSQSRVSQLIGQRPVKNIGAATARKIEHTFQKHTGWIDIPEAWAQDVADKKSEEQNYVSGDQIARLVSLFVSASETGRAQIMRMAENVEKGERLGGSTAIGGD